jgi:hypothetical protein
MKKNILFILLALLFPSSLLFANVDDDIWIYALHLEVKQGVLGIDSGEKYPYRTIPMAYEGPTTPDNFDFYGTIISGKGAVLGQFAFNKPATEVASLGKSVFTVHAPYFANADHITFYKKGGIKLFTLSVSHTSFCNDNNKCNSEVGENYVNCPNDCPVPTDLPPSTPEADPSPKIAPPPSSPISPESPPNISTSPSNPIQSTSTEGVPQTNTIRAVAFVAGTLAVILGVILWLRRKESKIP